jgi:ubiquinol-cytochrome c reductase cytochrome c subunit
MRIRRDARIRRSTAIRRAIGIAAACAIAAALLASAAPGAPKLASEPGSSSTTGDVQRGRALYTDSCSSCHGLDLQGIPGRAPKLRGVGARAADFYLSTGRMPLDKPGDEPLRRKPAFQQKDIDALTAYIASFGGPGIPKINPEQGEINIGQHVFTSRCAGCHQVVGEGGLVTNARVPRVKGIDPVQIAEAVRIGPYLMPPFSEHALDQHELNSVARYLQYVDNPEDRGGWGIGHIGPVPEGMVAWFIGLLALVFVIRLLGERMEGPRSE